MVFSSWFCNHPQRVRRRGDRPLPREPRAIVHRKPQQREAGLLFGKYDAQVLEPKPHRCSAYFKLTRQL